MGLGRVVTVYAYAGGFARRGTTKVAPVAVLIPLPGRDPLPVEEVLAIGKARALAKLRAETDPADGEWEWFAHHVEYSTFTATEDGDGGG